ncbi:hypothetical protein C8R48DRAFT_772779 [Suillus tomentosus]|nr:hypothetical protein C8R48DRAFT_772779 [Suillus tomentosus]
MFEAFHLVLGSGKTNGEPTQLDQPVLRALGGTTCWYENVIQYAGRYVPCESAVIFFERNSKTNEDIANYVYENPTRLDLSLQGMIGSYVKLSLNLVVCSATGNVCIGLREKTLFSFNQTYMNHLDHLDKKAATCKYVTYPPKGLFPPNLPPALTVLPNVIEKSQRTVIVHGLADFMYIVVFCIMVPEFAPVGEYCMIAIDVRGFEGSAHPLMYSRPARWPISLVISLAFSNMSRFNLLFVSVMTGVLKSATRRRPDIFYALVGVTVPYLYAAGPFADSVQLAAVMPKLAHQVFFESHTSEAIADLNKDMRRSLRATLRTVNSTPPDSFLTSTTTYLGAYDNVTECYSQAPTHSPSSHLQQPQSVPRQRLLASVSPPDGYGFGLVSRGLVQSQSAQSSASPEVQATYGAP